MDNLNKAILAGRLTDDPVVRYTGEETAVASFRLAIRRGGEKKGEEKITIINCVAFGSLAKICAEHLKKGKLVAVEGRIQIRAYENKSGEKKSSTEVVIDEMQML